GNTFLALGFGEQRPVAHGTAVDHGAHAGLDQLLALAYQGVEVRLAVRRAGGHQGRDGAGEDVAAHGCLLGRVKCISYTKTGGQYKPLFSSMGGARFMRRRSDAFFNSLRGRLWQPAQVRWCTAAPFCSREGGMKTASSAPRGINGWVRPARYRKG